MRTSLASGRGEEPARSRRRLAVRLAVAPGLLSLGAAAVAVPAPAGAVTSSQVSVATIPGLGKVLVFGHHVLYVDTSDPKRHSTCTGGCAQLWPPLLVSTRAAHHLGRVHGLGTIHHSKGRLQVTINGHPLYFFSGDTTLTAAKGQGVANVFFAVHPNGTVVHVAASGAAPASPSSPASTPSTSSTSSTQGTPGTHAPGSQSPAGTPPVSPPMTPPATSPPPTTTTTAPGGGGVGF